MSLRGIAPLLVPTRTIGPFPGTGGGSLDALVASWTAKALRGEPVTAAERNALVASLAAVGDLVARPPTVGTTPFDIGTTDSGDLAVLFGAVGGSFVDGDNVTVPTSIAPSGAAVVAPRPTPGVPPPPAPSSTPPSPAPPAPSADAPLEYQVVTVEQRRATWETVRGTLNALRLRPDQIETVPAETAPSGNPLIVAGAFIVVAGIAAFAVYEVSRAADEAATQQVRIREDAATARVVADLHAKQVAFASRLAVYQQTGSMPPAAPIETMATPAPTSNQTADWRVELGDRIASAALYGGLGLAGILGVTVVGSRVLGRVGRSRQPRIALLEGGL